MYSPPQVSDYEREMAIRQYVGASEVAALMGLHRYATARSLYELKTGSLEPEPQSEAAYWGQIHEAQIARAYTERTGKERQNLAGKPKRERPRFYALDNNLGAEPDDLITDNVGVLEIKTVGAFVASDWGQENSDAIAPYYLPQAHALMLATDCHYCDVAALIGGNKLQIYTVERSDDWCEEIEKVVRRFMKHLREGYPPPWDFSQKYELTAVKLLYKVVNTEEVDLPLEAATYRNEMKLAQDEKKRAEAEIKRCQGELLAMAGNAGIAHLPGGTEKMVRSQVKESEIAYTRKAYITQRFVKE